MLIVNNAEVNYGGTKALKGVSLKAEEGNVTTLIGGNGAGKSTCLRAISGLVRLSAGEIWFEDKRIDKMIPEEIVRAGIAHVPEGRRLFPWMTVFDNLVVGAYLRKDRKQIKRDLDRAYDYFPILAKRRNQLSKNLSGGEQQMLAFGRALLTHPSIFLFDEPSLGLAPILVREMGEHIEMLTHDGYSSLLVEQNAMMALTLAKKAYVLELGQVVLEDDAARLKANEHVKKAYLGL